jgi:hypothetical protein
MYRAKLSLLTGIISTAGRSIHVGLAYFPSLPVHHLHVDLPIVTGNFTPPPMAALTGGVSLGNVLNLFLGLGR